jgi:hypothetical protein
VSLRPQARLLATALARRTILSVFQESAFQFESLIANEVRFLRSGKEAMCLGAFLAFLTRICLSFNFGALSVADATIYPEINLAHPG